MVIQTFKQQEYLAFHEALMAKAAFRPMKASCTVGLIIDDAEYTVTLQPGRHNPMTVLQALRVRRDKSGPSHELITKNRGLSSLLEILISQGVS